MAQQPISPGKKAAQTKGPTELIRAGRMAAWTKRYGKDDVRNPHSRREVAPGPSTWIFQCNPRSFDVDSYLTFAPDRMTWLVRQHKKTIQIGDQVFLWRAMSNPNDSDSGIIAELRVDSRVANIPDEPAGSRFWLDGLDHSLSQDRVWLRVVRVADRRSMLRRSLLKADPILRNMRLLKFSNATNFGVTVEESRRLNQIWHSKTRVLTRDEIEEEQNRRVTKLEKKSMAELLAEYAKRQSENPNGRPRASMASTIIYERSDYVKAIARKRSNFKCEIPSCTSVPFLCGTGEHYCEVHHIVPLAAGGLDTIENAACVCPNHHRELHLGVGKVRLTGILTEIRKV